LKTFSCCIHHSNSSNYCNNDAI